MRRTRGQVRRYVDEVINSGDLDADADFVVPELAEESRHHLGQLFDAFSGLHVTIDDLFGEGDRVVARLTISGVHTGLFAGAAPTNKRITWTSIRIWRFVDGRQAESWAMQDRLGLLTQLGLIDSNAEPINWGSEI